MPNLTGNDQWWFNVELWMQKHPEDDDPELQVFIHFVRVYLKAGWNWTKIRQQFQTGFGIGYKAFYARMKKMKKVCVLGCEVLAAQQKKEA